MVRKRFVALVGCENYFGYRVLKPGMIVTLEKEPDNDYDAEAIKVMVYPLGKIGYIANSINTVPKGCFSAGRIYDTFHKKTKGIIRFVTKNCAIIELFERKRTKFNIKFTMISKISPPFDKKREFPMDLN
ncbi:HIRAN domain-containing protein [Thermovenabulum sp.]|uniref:HIRAN domain-containing protein n=1 Tax=Thermovenabulum sp. TaxID=3100335 RepID=UPI003C7AD2E8